MMNKSKIIILIVLLASFAFSIYFYSQMPDKMAFHWDFRGQVDSYISKFWAMFLMPFILVGLAALFLIIPEIDPFKANIKKFRKYYDGFIILFLVFMFSIHLWAILWNLGIEISPNTILPFGFGALFFYIGILLEKAKRNWFIGIRTPWTLSSEKVWNKTHKIGARLFKIAATITLFGAIFQKHAWLFVLIPVILAACYAYVYSYLEYRKR